MTIQTLYDCTACGAKYQSHMLFCLSCETFDCIIPSSTRSLDGMWREPTIKTAKELRQHRSQVEESGAYKIRIGPASLIGIYGMPGAGKSTMLCRWLDTIEGDILYCPTEEGIESDAVLERLGRMEIFRDGFCVGDIQMLSQLDDMFDSGRFSAIAIDSINATRFKVEDLRALADSKKIPVFFTIQVNKDGLPRGGRDLEHYADVVVEIDEHGWRIKKSRYQLEKSGTVATHA